jgi:Ala-tRNA(Pro) deacylase
MAIAKTLESYLLQHEVEYDLVPHPKTYSSRDTAKAAHVADDHIAKAVIVRDEQGYAMVVIPASHWLKLEALQQEADRDFVLAAESDATKLFPDCAEGAIPPLGSAYGLETFLDERLTSLANVYFEAGDHEDLVHVSGDAFHVLLKGVRHGHFSHDD